MVEEKETKTVEKNPWKISTIVVGIICLVLLVLVLSPGLTGSSITGGTILGDNDASAKLVDYLNGLTGGGVTLVSTEDVGNMYEVIVAYQGNNIPVYITKDGEYFVSSAQKMTAAQDQVQQQAAQDVPKTDKPVVEAFVFSYCPYGLQFEKALAPVYNLLKNTADINLVAIGAMHGPHEEAESLRQICIQENYGADKLWAYLDKFMASTAIGDCNSDTTCSLPLVDGIMSQLGIDKNKINTCIENDAVALYDDQNARAASLGIGGSPTFVINGVEVSVARNPEAIKQAVCNSFTEAPAECDQTLSTASASAWFGSDTTASASSAAQC